MIISIYTYTRGVYTVSIHQRKKLGKKGQGRKYRILNFESRMSGFDFHFDILPFGVVRLQLHQQMKIL